MEIEKELKLLVLCGGKGTRVASISNGKPKSLLALGAKTLIDVVLENLVKQLRISEIFMLTGFRSEHIENYYDKGHFEGVKLHFIKEQSPLGTGGAVLNAIQLIGPDEYLVINGDTMIDSDLNVFLKYSRKTHSDITIAAFSVNDMEDYGGIKVDNSFNLIGFMEKRTSGAGLVNAGIYHIKDSHKLRHYLLSYLAREQQELSMEKQILTETTLSKKVWIDLEGKFLDVGTPKRFKDAEGWI
jgi:NDP-sugar pyrophosphorylase family protein